MKIITKFNVDDIVKPIYQNLKEDRIITFRVMEILTQTCYSTIQIFYMVKGMEAIKKFDSYKKEGSFIWEVGININNDGGLAWTKLREDEIISATKKEIKVFKTFK